MSAKRPRFTDYDYSVFFAMLVFFVVVPLSLVFAGVHAVTVTIPESNRCKAVGGTYVPGNGELGCRVYNKEKLSQQGYVDVQRKK